MVEERCGGWNTGNAEARVGACDQLGGLRSASGERNEGLKGDEGDWGSPPPSLLRAATRGQNSWRPTRGWSCSPYQDHSSNKRAPLVLELWLASPC